VDSSTLLPNVDLSALRSAVRQTLGRDTAEVVSWQAQSIHAAINSVTGGLLRLSGAARDHGDTLPWSLVLKIARNAVGFGSPEQVTDPAGSNYWKREPLLYQSRLLERLPPGIVAPRCYGVTEPARETAWIWLEDVVESTPGRWPIERFGLAARHLGAFNGAYLAEWPLPTDRCLTPGWLRAAVDGTSQALPQQAAARENPLALRHGWSAALFDRQERLLAEKEILLAAIERLPVTFCHLDAFRGNLLARRGSDGQDETVAIDWSFAGHGVIGQDLYAMIAAPVFFNDADPDQMAEVDSVVFEGFIEGLRDAGWHGDPRLARLGYTAAAGLRWGLAPYGLLVVDPDFAALMVRTTGHSLEENLERCALILRFILDQAQEAQELLGVLF
jgi:hypothetical protein